MDLPTYTNIWRIEKRLYKLYDLRLPMPLPIVWIGVFVGVLVPWSLLLLLLHVPMEMPWHVLFLVPPGIVTWLSTRPVIEGKRLTELLESQLRYLGEPRAWYRLTPRGEPESISFSGRVWRASPAQVRVKAPRKARHSQRKQAAVPATARAVRPAVAAAAAAAGQAPVAERPVWGAAARRTAAPALGAVQVTAGEPAPQVKAPLPVESPVRQAPPTPTPKPEPTPAAKPELIPAAKAEPTPVSKAELSPVSKAEPTTVSKAEPTSVSKVEATSVPEAGAAPVGEASAVAEVETPAVPARSVANRKPERGAAGKPVDTEALRRLRRLAATADAQPTDQTPETPTREDPELPTREASGTPTREDPEPRVDVEISESRADAETAESRVDAAIPEDDARLKHRKGQPPRQFSTDSQRVWPPLRPDAKPVSRPPTRETPQAPEPVEQAPEPVEQAQEAEPAERPQVARLSDAPVREAPPLVFGGNDKQADVPGPRPGEREARVRRVESVVGRDSGGWRRIAQVVVGGGGVRTDGSEIDEARARAVFSGSRRIVVLGCTGGAGQSTTALMLGHTFARYRDDRVLAVDANAGSSTLTSRIKPESPETLTSLLSGLDQVRGYLTMRGYTTRTASGLEVIGADSDADAEQRLADRSLFSDDRLGQAMHLLDRYYKLAVMDPAAALAARVLPYADQLVLVVPASEEAAEAVAMTYEWLDGHGCADLRRRAVMVVNGVSRRSMSDVEQAESVASGRCRAIVRVPWEDDLAPGGADVVEPGQLRAAGRRAYLALAGVVVAGFAAQSVRANEEEMASDPPGTRIGER